MAKKKLTLEDMLVPKEEIPYEVPENWCWVKLGGLVDLERGITFPSSAKKDEMKDGLIPCLRTANVQTIIETDDLIYIDKSYMKSNENKLVREGDIIMSTANSLELVGKLAMVENINQDMTFGGFVLNIRNKGYISNKYLFYYLRSMFLLGEFQKIASHTTNIANINAKKIENINIAIPPLAEQERIVNRIESLFGKVDKARELVDEARDGFEKRRAAILEKAFSGELTTKWREVNDFSIESILPKIEDLNKSEKKKFEFSEASEMFDIPSNWKWMKLKDLCTKFKYGTSAKSQPEGIVPVLRMGNLQGGIIDWNNLVYTSNEDEIKKYDLIKGDLLFNRTNSPELVGKTSIYMGEQEAIYAGYLIRVRTYEDVNSRYINYFMNSTFAKARCYEVKTDGVSQSNINSEKLGDFDIPLPSIEEQNEIVRILDRVLDKERNIGEVSNVNDSIDVIKKSILAKAFRGELGSNDIDEKISIELLKTLI